MFDVVGVTGLLVFGALTTWLALRARRARNRVVKWVGLVVAGLLTVTSALAIGLALTGFYRINFPHARALVAGGKVVATPDQVARGAEFGAMCAQCHSPNGESPLVGRNFLGDGGPPIGSLYAQNLTPAGEINDWSDAEVIRAIREGVHKNGRALIIMPSEVFHNLSDADVQAVVAYLRSQPATGPNTPSTKLNVLAALVIGSGIAPTSVQEPITQPIVAPPASASLDYGKYLVSIIGCAACHGEKFTGRKPGSPGPPAGPSLALILPHWSADDFVRTLRTGVDPNQHKLTAEMPWKAISTIAHDDGLRAMYAYLRSVMPSETKDR